MKHLAIRSRSVGDPNKPFTAPGLGDRIHILTAGWCYGQVHKTPVTLHLTSDKWDKNKPESFLEIQNLFPLNSVLVQSHPVQMLSELEWIEYLVHNGIDAELFSYLDHLGWYESREKLDISKYLRNIPLLHAEKKLGNYSIPNKFITCQWDSSGALRRIGESARLQILSEYLKAGYEIVTIGGESTQSELRNSLKHIAYAISSAEFHVGVDSGFFHLAQLYKPLDRIHLYKEPRSMWSHHALRAYDKGLQINVNYKKMNVFDKIHKYVLYDNRIIVKAFKKSWILSKMFYSTKTILRKFSERILKS